MHHESSFCIKSMQHCIVMRWDDLRIFLAVARAKSFSAAARELGVNQSTVSRRLATMERDMGVQLVERGVDGTVVTVAGSELLALARNVEDEFIRIDRRVTGRDARLGGRLRVTCVDMMVDRYLAPHFARFAVQHPDIDLSVLTPFQPMDLVRHEADVAIRVTDDPPDALIGRRLFSFAMGVYASPDFVAVQSDNPDPANFSWVGWESDAYNRLMITNHFPKAKVRHRVDSMFVLNSLVREGFGASVLACYWADTDAGLRRIYNDPIAGTDLGLWVLVHPDVRRAARVRAFTSFITEVFLSDRDLFEGRLPASGADVRN